jgi:hypothetical protein
MHLAPSPNPSSQVILALIHNERERLEKPLMFQQSGAAPAQFNPVWQHHFYQ